MYGFPDLTDLGGLLEFEAQQGNQEAVLGLALKIQASARQHGLDVRQVANIC